jgi:hypothetical protein
MAQQQTVTKKELEDTVNDIWQIAQDADGSRSGMQDALDEIQERCVEVCPEIEETDDGDDDLDENDE